MKRLTNVSVVALRAELQRRVGKLGGMRAKRDALDEEINELQSLAEQAPGIARSAAKARRKPGRKPARRAKVATKAKHKETGSMEMRKHTYAMKGGIARTPEFEKKGLASFSVNCGVKCGHYAQLGIMRTMRLGASL